MRLTHKESDMTTKTLKPCLIAVMLGAAAPLAVSAGDYNKDMSDKSTMERAGDRISDAALTTKVKTALIAEGELKALDINVDSNQGVVTLSGTVESDAQVDLAEQVVANLDGVKGINNRLEARGS
jgi:hyperosmotically inducible periplasmic protein